MVTLSCLIAIFAGSALVARYLYQSYMGRTEDAFDNVCSLKAAQN